MADTACMLAFLLDLVFQPQCAACGTLARTLCAPCQASLEVLGPACPGCAEPTGDFPVVCRRCARDPLPLERIVSPWRFGGALATAIKRLKFGHHTQVARDVAPLWAPVIAAAAEDDALVVPVPHHWRRRWQRGFDHTAFLAEYACRAAGLPPPVHALRRVRGAPPQSTLSAAERYANVRGAFALARPLDAPRVVLVDDVVTTGATLAAAARALVDGGVHAVIGVALARAISAP